MWDAEFLSDPRFDTHRRIIASYQPRHCCHRPLFVEAQVNLLTSFVQHRPVLSSPIVSHSFRLTPPPQLRLRVIPCVGRRLSWPNQSSCFLSNPIFSKRYQTISTCTHYSVRRCTAFFALNLNRTNPSSQSAICYPRNKLFESTRPVHFRCEIQLLPINTNRPRSSPIARSILCGSPNANFFLVFLERPSEAGHTFLVSYYERWMRAHFHTHPML